MATAKYVKSYEEIDAENGPDLGSSPNLPAIGQVRVMDNAGAVAEHREILQPLSLKLLLW